MGSACSACVNQNDSAKIGPTDSHASSSLNLTVDERKLITSTWKRINYDFTSRGVRVFDLILRQPELKALFPFRHLSGETLKQNALFRAHASRFVQSVSAVVEELEMTTGKPHGEGGHDPLKQMNDWKIGTLLNTLGQAHASIPSLSPSLFKDVGKKSAIEALTTVWKEDLGSYWTNDVEKAWTKLFDAIISEMYRGLVKATNERGAAPPPAQQNNGSVKGGGSVTINNRR